MYLPAGKYPNDILQTSSTLQVETILAKEVVLDPLTHTHPMT